MFESLITRNNFSFCAGGREEFCEEQGLQNYKSKGVNSITCTRKLEKQEKKTRRKVWNQTWNVIYFPFFSLLNYILISSIHVPYKYKTFLQFINAGDLIIYPENLLFPLSQLQSENVFFSATPVSFTGFWASKFLFYSTLDMI